MDSSFSGLPNPTPPPLSSSSYSPTSIEHQSNPIQYPQELTYDYLSEPNENLICPICRNPFIDPVMCESTDHIFCRVCLIKSLEISPTCPIDRQPLSLSIVSPAPKIICKLVDELLVACPLKSTSNCDFVCQRDLIPAHLRSHKLHPGLNHQAPSHPHHPSQSPSLPSDRPLLPPSSSSPSIPQDPHPSLSSLEHPQLPTLQDQHPPFHPLRFQWLSGHATLVDQDAHRPPLPSHTSTAIISSGLYPPTPFSGPNTATHSVDLIPCPFQRFGCSFRGTIQAIQLDHLPLPSDRSISSSDLSSSSRCTFYSVQVILNCFERLESRNAELKQELSQSLVKRSELVSGLESLKASFRKLWQSHHHQGLDSPLVSPSAHIPATPFTPQVLPLFSGIDPSSAPSNSNNHLPLNPTTSSDHNQVPGTTSPTRSCSDGSLLICGSRLNYDSLNGHRIRRLPDLDPNSPAPSPACHMNPVASPALASKPKIRVSTFLRKGRVLTRATDSYAPSPSLEPAIATSSSHHPLSCSLPPAEERSNAVLRHTALPKIVTQSCGPSSSNPNTSFQLPHYSDRRSDSIYPLSASQPSQLSTDQTPLSRKVVLSSHPPSTDHTVNPLINHQILQIIQSVQQSFNLWQSIQVGSSSTSNQTIISSAKLDHPPDSTSKGFLPSSSSSDEAERGSIYETDLLEALNRVETVMGDLIKKSRSQSTTRDRDEDEGSSRSDPMRSSKSQLAPSLSSLTATQDSLDTSNSSLPHPSTLTDRPETQLPSSQEQSLSPFVKPMKL